MNILDLIIGGVLGYMAYSGFRMGLLRILMEAVGIVLGVFVGLQYYQDVMAVIQGYVAISPLFVAFCSFGFVWLSVFLGVVVLGKFADLLFSASAIGPMNRLGGLILGAAKGVVFLIPIVLPLFLYGSPLIEGSRLLAPILPVISGMTHVSSAQHFFSSESVAVAYHYLQSFLQGLS